MPAVSEYVCVSVCVPVCWQWWLGEIDQHQFGEESLWQGCLGTGEGPTLSLEQWLGCWLHNLTWDHGSLLISYAGFVRHLIILSLGVTCFAKDRVNQGSSHINSFRTNIGSASG